MGKRYMKIVFRDDDLNYDFNINDFNYYEQIKDIIKVSFFCVPKIDFKWPNYLEVCESFGPGSNPTSIRKKMKWYEDSRYLHENIILMKYLLKNVKLGWMSICLHGSKHYQTVSDVILERNFSFGAEYLLSSFEKRDILHDIKSLEKFDSKISWFAPPQNLISPLNLKKVASLGLNISCDLTILKNLQVFVRVKLRSIVKLFYWKVVKRIRFYYPFVVEYADIKLLGVLRLNSETDINDLFNQICYLEKMGGEVIAINTHLSAFNIVTKNGKTVGENLVELVMRLKRTNKFEFVSVNEL